MVKCPNCGVINTDEAPFCSLCLNPLKEIVNPEERIIAYREALSRQHFNYGTDFQLEGALEDAIAEYSEAICLNPEDASAFNNRGTAYKDSGSYEQAIEDYEEAIRLEPNNASAYYNRGVAYEELGQYQRSIEDFNEVIRLDPKRTYAFTARENVYKLIKEDKKSP